MRIYKRNNSNSIVTTNKDKTQVSTRSSYPETFIKSLTEGNYGYFSLTQVDVEKIDDEVIIFAARTMDDFMGMETQTEREIYNFIGEVENTSELLQLLETIKE